MSEVVAVLATVTMKESSLKSLMTGEKVPAKCQPWTRGEQIAQGTN